MDSTSQRQHPCSCSVLRDMQMWRPWKWGTPLLESMSRCRGAQESWSREQLIISSFIGHTSEELLYIPLTLAGNWVDKCRQLTVIMIMKIIIVALLVAFSGIRYSCVAMLALGFPKVFDRWCLLTHPEILNWTPERHAGMPASAGNNRRLTLFL